MIDHRNAERLAAGLRALDLTVEQHTNMVFVSVPAQRAAPLAEQLRQKQVLVLPGTHLRLVTHLDVDEAGIERALGAFKEFFAAETGAPAGEWVAGRTWRYLLRVEMKRRRCESAGFSEAARRPCGDIRAARAIGCIPVD